MLERFLRALSGDPCDQVPWVADISYWIDYRIAIGAGESQWKTERGYLELCRCLGCMPYQRYETWNPYETVYTDAVQCIDEVSSDRRRIRWVTPVGEISKEWAYASKSRSWAPTRYPVSSREDLEVLLCLLEHRQIRPAGLDEYHERTELWKQYGGLPGLGMTQDPLAQMLVYWSGVANTTYLTADYPHLMHEVYDRMESQEQDVVDALCELSPPLVHILDNQSSEIMGGYFPAWMEARYRRTIDRFHGAGIRTVTHIDGTVWPLLRMVEQVGFDGAEALTPKPSGDLSVHEIGARVTGTDFVLWGGVPAVLFSPPHTWPEVRAHVESLLEAWRGHPFVVGVGDCVPADGQIDFVRRIADMLI